MPIVLENNEPIVRVPPPPPVVEPNWETLKVFLGTKKMSC